MTTIRIVEPFLQEGTGGAATTEREVEIPSTPLFIEIDGTEYEPAVTKSIEANRSFENETITDQCGRSETRNTGDRNWTVTVDGIVSKANREGNLRLARLKEINNGDTIKVRSDVHSGEMVVRDLTVSQSNDLNSVDVGFGEEIAIEFQLQLRSAGPQ